MKKTIFKRQITWIIILLTGLVLAGIVILNTKYGNKVESYMPLLKFSENSDTMKTVNGLNLGFEKKTSVRPLPDGWIKWGYDSYKISIDSEESHSGNYSVRIESKSISSKPTFGCIARAIEATFEGKEIAVSAFIKTKNVDEPIGLLLRIDDENSNTLVFDNMMERKENGPKEWKEYSVSLPLPEEAKTIYIGAILSGNGQLWVDDFEILVDGKELIYAKNKKPKTYKAYQDNEFTSKSSINIIDYTTQNLNDLELLCRIWGFVKYYHPAIASGDYNWDAELFRVMPSILKAKDNKKRDQILLDWINKLGKFKTEKIKSDSDEKIKLEANLSWIQNNGMELALIRKLEKIKIARKPNLNYYVNQNSFVGNTIFKHEKNYRYVTYDSGIRLLALFRYWNMIEYFFPYRHLTDKSWDEVLKEFIPLFLDAQEYDYKKLLLKLIAQVQDTHANIYHDNTINKWRGENFAPYGVSFIENKAVVTDDFGPDKKNQLKKGDIIVSIDGKEIDKIVEEKRPYTPASNEPTQMRNIANELLRSNNQHSQVEIIRSGIQKKINLEHSNSMSLFYNNSNRTKKDSYGFVSNDIGYIYPGTIKNDSIPTIMEKLKDTKGIVIDFRCYPSDFCVFTLGKYLMPQPTDFVRFTGGYLNQPGKFTFSEPLKVGEVNPDYYKGKIVIIVNEETQSSAEYHTMAFQQAPKAMVIGSTTAGADGNVSEIVLPGNVKTMISGIGIYYPDGTETQRTGVRIDMEIRPTIKGFLAGKDELMDKAIELINQK